MIVKTNNKISSDLLNKAINNLPEVDFKLSLNEPTDNFFYDPWKIKSEFKDTVWDQILSTLGSVGEARLIKLESCMSYTSHADIDDRWHLSLTAEQSYLIDLDNMQMHKIDIDGYWYDMDAGKLHTASNFGRGDRVQLVVRKLLNKNALRIPVTVKIVPDNSNIAHRYVFDQSVSPWLNFANKKGLITNFSYQQNIVTVNIEESEIVNLKSILPNGFKLIVDTV
jgi:hypothetical protein